MAGIIVIFDFDRTIIDSDSDNWVVTEMGLTPLFKELRSSMPWNSLMVISTFYLTVSSFPLFDIFVLILMVSLLFHVF